MLERGNAADIARATAQPLGQADAVPVQECLVGEAVAVLLVELGDQRRHGIGYLLQLGLAVVQRGLCIGQLGAFAGLLLHVRRGSAPALPVLR
ncbi:hypothetical protein G6F65_014796 [Rhizopus arrhizus]|nr:hypothetical protein G6F65_014796 [Rhizopus arrhizus]